ncbi:hypothetical protein D3C78_1295500 [compost metagenome]
MSRRMMEAGLRVTASTTFSKGISTESSFDMVVARSQTGKFIEWPCKSVEIEKGKRPRAIAASATLKEKDAPPWPISSRMPSPAQRSARLNRSSSSMMLEPDLPLKQWVTTSPGPRISSTSS